uniref:Uncharacterized protein n=1 Tax=Triticum urartu TaxID=4572 RepID=A0A8R7QVK0_TRIUA
MGSRSCSYVFLLGLCSLLLVVLSGQRTLARDTPVSTATALAPFVHAPAKGEAGGHRADVDKPRVSDEKPTITGITWRPLPKIHCPPIFCATKAATATAPAATAHP